MKIPQTEDVFSIRQSILHYHFCGYLSTFTCSYFFSNNAVFILRMDYVSPVVKGLQRFLLRSESPSRPHLLKTDKQTLQTSPVWRIFRLVSGILSWFPENPFIWKRHMRTWEPKQRPVIVNLNVDPSCRSVGYRPHQSRRRRGWRSVSDGGLFKVKNRLFKALRHTGRCVSVYYATQEKHTHTAVVEEVLLLQ